MIDLKGFDGIETGMPTEDRWVYPTIGYNSREGIFYVGEDQVKAIEGITLLAVRQCKEITDAAGIIHRYPLRTRKVDMVEGDFSSRLQIVCALDGELYLFGARSWTARAAFMNPGGGPYSDEKFARGIWHDLNDHVKTVKAETGKTAPPLCWKMTLAVAKQQITVGSGRNTSKSYPFQRASEFEFIGADAAIALAALYEEEALDEWVAEWGVRATVEVAEEEPQTVAAVELDDIPF